MLTAPFYGGLFFLFLSSYLLYRSLQSKKLQAESHNWPITKGLITLSEASRSPGSSSYRYWLNFTYEVNGKAYKHNVPAFYNVNLRKDCEAFAEKYKKGDTVDVHYRASNPQQSVLEIEMNGKGKNDGIIISSVLVVFSIIFTVVAALGYIS